MTTPAQTRFAVIEWADRAVQCRRWRGQCLGKGAGHQQAGAGQIATKIPFGGGVVPRSIPAEAFAVHETPSASHFEVLHDSLKCETLRQVAPIITSGQPDIAPDQARARGEFDATVLKVPRLLVRDRGAR